METDLQVVVLISDSHAAPEVGLDTSFRTALDGAVATGILRAEQVAPLAAHFAAYGFGNVTPAATNAGAYLSELSQPKDVELPRADEDSEAPRFVRGFHDVLITVGLIVALVGATALGSMFVLIPAVIVLAEILVKRQRLALPAFALTVAYVIGVVWIVISAIGDSGATLQFTAVYAASAAALVPFYWRYRVPVSLAALVLSAIGFGFFATVVAIGGQVFENEAAALPALIAALAFSLIAFCAAMYFDVRDRQRLTRRSDVAFWLHLGAAPALLNSALSLALWNTKSGSYWLQNLSVGQSAIALVLITLFMMTGIAIDRRAFVTAGILSLGYAISTLMKGVNFETNDLFAISALAVGIIVLVIGIGWLPIRARVVGMLPNAIRDMVPPVAA
jgi:hypothetical protein